MKRLNNSMVEGPLLPSIISYTIPIMLTSILQLLFNAADLIVVGRFCGSVSVAAVGATGAITGLIVNLFVGISVGASVTVAHALGGKNDEATHRTVHTALPTALVSGIFLTLVGVPLARPLLELMETPDTVLPLSTVYMQIYFAGMTFNMVYNFCSAILRAAGDSKSPLIFLTIAGVLNVGLNVIFVTVFHMNVAGVSLATIISQAVSAVLVVIALMRRTDSCKLNLRKIRFYKPQLLKMLRIGIPSGINSSLFSISNVTIQSSINSFGDIAMSGNAAAQNIDSFVYVSLNAFYQTTMNFTGQNAGAGNYKRVGKVVGTCMVCVAVLGAILSTVVVSLGPQLLSIYITDSPESITYGMLRLWIVCAPYFLCGLMEIPCGALRGLGVSMPPMLASIIGVCGIRITWVLFLFPLPQFHSLESVYCSYPVSWFVTFLLQMSMFILVYRKKLKQHPQAQAIANE